MSTDTHRQHYGITLAVLVLSALSYALLQTMVVPALPAIQEELGASTNSVAWVLTVYLLAASIFTPIFGRLGDIFGKERILLLVLAMLAVGLLLAAVTHSLPLLVLARAIQGASGAVFPLAIGIIRDEFPREKVATGIGLISATFGIGGGLGLPLSGVIVDNLSYEWVFWVALVLVLITMVATHLFVPESPIKTPARIDWVGAAGLSISLSALLFGVSQGSDWGWTSAPVLGLFVTAAVVMVAWVRYEQRVPSPLVDIGLLRLRAVWPTNLVALLLGVGMYSGFVLIPQLVQEPASTGYGFGASVTEAGLFLLPSTIVMLVFGPLSGALTVRFGPRLPLLAGLTIVTGAFVLLTTAHGEVWQILLASGMMGAGIGLAFAALANLIVDAVPQAQTGEATGMNTIMRTVGGAIGAQVVASVIAGSVTDGFPTDDGFTIAFAIATFGMATALLAGFLVPGRRRSSGGMAPHPVEARPPTRA